MVVYQNCPLSRFLEIHSSFVSAHLTLCLSWIMRLSQGFLGLILPALIDAGSINSKESGLITSIECRVIQIVVDLLGECNTATAFCDSVLAPKTTVTATAWVCTQSPGDKDKCWQAPSTSTSSSCAYTYQSPTTTKWPPKHVRLSLTQYKRRC